MPDFDTSVAALVLNFGEYPFHQGSLGVIRSLGSVGIPVFAIQRSRFIPSGASRYLSGKFLWKSDGKNVAHFLEGLATIAKKLDRPTILVPTDDLSSILIAENSHLLSSQFTFAQPPAELPRSLANKRSLYHTCRRLGIACPATFFPESREQLLDFAGAARFPVIVKAIEPWLAPRGAKSTAIVLSRQELLKYCVGPPGQDPIQSFMIQEMIPASVSVDWCVHGYCNKQSQPIALFTGIKFRSYPAFAGPTTLGQAVRNDSLEQQTVELLGAIGYRGPLDMDYRFDKRDGRYYLLDFNPRLGAQFRLFRTADGMDVVRTMHLDLTQRTPPIGRQVEGRKFVVEIQDLLASRVYIRNGALTFKEWYRSIRKIDETAWFRWDDPLPFLLLSLHLPWRALSRARWLSILGRQPKTVPVRAEDTCPSKREAVAPKQPAIQR